MGVKFNEGLACEAIVRRLESRDQRVRANVRFPEKEQHAFSVEATFEIGDQLYAMEHTGIEPFEGHMKMEGEAERHFVPIEDALKGNLDTAALFELYMPVDAFRGRRKTKVRSIQRKLIDWVKATAPTVQKPTLAGYGGTQPHCAAEAINRLLAIEGVFLGSLQYAVLGVVIQLFVGATSRLKS